MVSEGMEGSTSICVFCQAENIVNKFRENADANCSGRTPKLRVGPTLGGVANGAFGFGGGPGILRLGSVSERIPRRACV